MSLKSILTMLFHFTRVHENGPTLYIGKFIVLLLAVGHENFTIWLSQHGAGYTDIFALISAAMTDIVGQQWQLLKD